MTIIMEKRFDTSIALDDREEAAMSNATVGKKALLNGLFPETNWRELTLPEYKLVYQQLGNAGPTNPKRGASGACSAAGAAGAAGAARAAAQSRVRAHEYIRRVRSVRQLFLSIGGETLPARVGFG